MIEIRQIKKSDNHAVFTIIRTVFEEHGINRPGTAYYDPCLEIMYEYHTGENRIYFVAEVNGKIAGGAGIYPTEGLAEYTCELVKMYLLKEYRGTGIGRMLIESCIEAAKNFGYKRMYLETTPELNAAIKMYEKFGFLPLKERMGNTGHHSCGIFMLRNLA